MVSMNYFQLRGALGELQTLESLLGFGMSVNSLTGSDFGFDLHAQLPDTQEFAEASPAPDLSHDADFSWPMSARTVHIQVKTLNAGAKLQLPVSTIRAWIAGSRVGTPTFLVINSRDKKTGEPISSRLVSPFGLSGSFATGKPEASSHTLKYDDPRFSSAFLTSGTARKDVWARIDLWSAAPAIMASAEDLVPLPGDYIRGAGSAPWRANNLLSKDPRIDYDLRVVKLIADLAHSYLTCFEPNTLADISKIDKTVHELAQTYDDGTTSWYLNENASKWIQDEVKIISSAGGSKLRIPPGSFTASTDRATALAELHSLVQRISSHAPHWQSMN